MPGYQRDMLGCGASSPDPERRDGAKIAVQFVFNTEEDSENNEAFAPEREPAHDSAVGIHYALARIFRKADDQKRSGVLTAHPSPMGKLAGARRLTVESAVEQADAGLGNDREREFAEACRQVERTAWLRLETMLP